MNVTRIALGFAAASLVSILVAAGCSGSDTTGGSGGSAGHADGGGGQGGAPSTSSSSSASSASSASSTSGSLIASSSSSGAGPDPENGMFTMEEALAGLPDGPGPLRAIIDTDLGELTCELYPDVAPIGVANFVGLARGVRPWVDPTTQTWVKKPFYDGLLFHRVIPDFVAQGGDPLGTGRGGPGYTFGLETSPDLTHVAGSLAYANTGQPNSNGSQFYVCETPQPTLDGAYTIFGLCSPVSVVTALTHVPRDGQDKPTTPLHMKTVTITRAAP